MAHLGVDDTDSRQGMCTTFLATELVRELEDWDLLGYPRLVRLNPNIPWKTRGNGAVCLNLGWGRGTPSVVGEVDGREVLAYPRGDPAPVTDNLENRVRRAFRRWCAFDDPTTHPGYALLDRRPAPGLYWRAVRGIVPLADALTYGEGRGRVRGFKKGRGRIGALAAVSWRPRDRTYEVLAYRARERWGTPREIDESSVVELDRRFPSTFNNYDFANRHVALAPRSPCPVLLGVRGDIPVDLVRAFRTLVAEAPDRWLLFETNQGTDDHVLPENGRSLLHRTTVSVTGEVSGEPRTLLGGHVVFSIRRQNEEETACTAYEPSKQLRRTVRALRSEDRVRVVGAVRESPPTLNVEKLAVLALAPGPGKRALATGWYEPPVSARRHLAKPLKRFGPGVRPTSPRHP